MSEITGSVGKKLEAGRDAAYLSRKLATIVLDLDVHLDLEQARPEHFEPAKVEALFRELEFRSLMPRLTALEQAYGKQGPQKGQQLSMFESSSQPRQPAMVASHPKPTSSEMHAAAITTPEALQRLVQRLNEASVIAFDTETTSTDQMRAELVGISLAVEPGYGFYIPVGHRQEAGAPAPSANRDRGVARPPDRPAHS